MGEHEALEGALQILGPDGKLNEGSISDLDLKPDDLVELYRSMVLVRRADLEATALQRQGELAVYPPLLGQEAAQVGSAYALGPTDFVFPSYRELGVAVVRGIDLVDYLHFYRGTWHGGRYDPLKSRFGMVAVPIASQIPHAVGYALGAKLDGEPIVTMVYFGDGATSQGDFHEGCNFASVYDAPVVLFCQNNQWAISVPVEAQTVAPIYEKAKGFGFNGVRVDGNDVLAVHRATKEAVDLARTSSRPTLIEAVTYRMGPHSTADDAGRYQPKEQVEQWKLRDPIARFETFLIEASILTDQVRESVAADSDDLAKHIRSGIVGAPPPEEDDLFRFVFDQMSPHLLRQQESMRAELEDLGD